jgi:hypothetical protein
VIAANKKECLMPSRLIALAVSVFAAGAVACSGGGGTSNMSPAQAVAASATKTKAAGSAKVYVATSISGAAGSFTFSGTGAFDYGARAGRMSFDMSQLAKATGTQVSGDDVRMDMIFRGLVIYMRWPLLSRSIGSAKPWIKLDLEELGKSSGMNLGQISQFSQNDPSQTLDYLRGAADVKEVGSEDVRGVNTTHYHAIVDLEQVAKDAPDALAASIRRLIATAGGKRIPTDAWIDDEGLLRRMRYAYETPSAATGQSARFSVTMELFDFGADVNAESPPAHDVTDLGALLRG